MIDRFTEDESTLGWLDDDDGSKMSACLQKIREQGFHRWPDHVPVPLKGYEYEIYATLVFSKPRCPCWTRFIFKTPLGMLLLPFLV